MIGKLAHSAAKNSCLLKSMSPATCLHSDAMQWKKLWGIQLCLEASTATRNVTNTFLCVLNVVIHDWKTCTLSSKKSVPSQINESSHMLVQ